MDTTRRGFLGGAATAGFAPAFGAGGAAGSGEELKLGLCTYSLRDFSRRLAVRKMSKLGTPYINIKDVHLPLKISAEDMDKALKEFDKAGLKILGGGTIDFKKDDEADMRAKFEYAKRAGMPLIVAAPTAVTLPKLEKFVKEYDIKIAVHNHGPEDKHFPTPQSALKIVKDLDPRCGLCIDVGHTARCGVDVVEAFREAGPRLLHIHMKDLADFAAKGKSAPVGEGKIPVPTILRELKKMNFQEGVMLEYEIDEDDPLPGIMKSLAYMRGVLAGMRG